MQQSADEILNDLQKFVAGRGREDNFCYSKTYSPSSYITCVDFSPWVGKRLLANDTYALAVFHAQLSKDSSYGVSISISLADDGEAETDDTDDDDFVISFENEIKRHEKRIIRIIQFPFDEYFTGEFSSAKFDVIVAWLLNFSREQLAKILMAYDISVKNAQSYLDSYNKEKNTQLTLPPNIPNSIKIDEFRKEFRKLPLSSRLHLFDVLTYSGYKTKKPKIRQLSDMTLYDTRKMGIDEYESASILSQNKLITSLSDGTGYINPEYIDIVTTASEYAIAMVPVFRGLESDVSDKLFSFDNVIGDLFDE